MKFNPKMLIAATGLSFAGVLGLQGDYTAKHEGLSLTAYLDSVGVKTICYGKTKDVFLGQKMTLAECTYYLRVELKEHCEPVWKDTDPTVTPIGVFIATCDWIYQYGQPKYSTSTLREKYLAKDFQGMCKQFPRWKYAGKKDCSVRSNNCYGVYTRGLDREALCNASL